MEMRNLGRSGLKVSELCLGTMTFGGKGFFSEIGEIEVSEAKSLWTLLLMQE
jgi:aryl-alcohol dehydrogenase-like predicted oxidoreductase